MTNHDDKTGGFLPGPETERPDTEDLEAVIQGAIAELAAFDAQEAQRRQSTRSTPEPAADSSIPAMSATAADDSPNPSGQNSPDQPHQGWFPPPPTRPYKSPDHYMMSARGLRACLSTPDNPVSLDDVADRFNGEMFDAGHDAGYEEMLYAHTHLLNAVFGAMLERGMNNPDPFSIAISAGLRAQKQFSDIARLRVIRAMEEIARDKWSEKKSAISWKQNEHFLRNR